MGPRDVGWYLQLQSGVSRVSSFLYLIPYATHTDAHGAEKCGQCSRISVNELSLKRRGPKVGIFYDGNASQHSRSCVSLYRGSWTLMRLASSPVGELPCSLMKHTHYPATGVAPPAVQTSLKEVSKALMRLANLNPRLVCCARQGSLIGPLNIIAHRNLRLKSTSAL